MQLPHTLKRWNVFADGDKNTPKLMMHLHYYKMMIDGETILTVDAYNPVVGPEESGSNAIRSAIGL